MGVKQVHISEKQQTSADQDSFKRFVVRGKAFDVSAPCVMGILNVTPDSFSDGGKFNSPDSALHQAMRMANEGAIIIDVGGESTRPGSEPVCKQEELQRTIPVIEQIADKLPDVFISIDTTKYTVAKAALEAGAHFVNDVSGLQKEPRFAALCAHFGAGLIIMHAKGEPKTMQQNPHYDDVVQEVITFLQNACKTAQSAGVECIITDPGIGFGKTTEHNLLLIKHLNALCNIGWPVLLGASRKSVIGKLLHNRPAEGRLAGTIAMHYQGLLNGADILRVHDVQEAIDAILIYNALTVNKHKT